MKIIEPSIQVEPYDPILIQKRLERAMRTCYQTQGSITDDSYKRLLAMAINSGHQSILEHEKISTIINCSIGAYKDLTRHRHANFSISSTRYCNYSKNKFGNQITFIEPCNIEKDTEDYNNWKKLMEASELVYMKMIKNGCTPDQCREVLPHSTAAQMYMTANIREWRHIFELRAQKEAHPEVQQIMIPLLLKFQKDMPTLFGDIQYNKDFDKNKYANINIWKDKEMEEKENVKF